MPRYPHSISLNDEQEIRLKMAIKLCGLSLPDILMIAVEELIKGEVKD